MTLEGLLALMEVSELQMTGHLKEASWHAGRVNVGHYELTQWRKEMRLAILHLKQMQRSGH